MMKIVEKLLEHDNSLKKCIKEKSYKTRATAKENAPDIRIETN